LGSSGKLMLTSAGHSSPGTVSRTRSTQGSSVERSVVSSLIGAQRDAADPEERGLLRGRQRAGVPRRVAEVWAEVVPGRRRVDSDANSLLAEGSFAALAPRSRGLTGGRTVIARYPSRGLREWPRWW
jgi:hypothetical protein